MARRNDYKRVDSLLKSLLGDESNAEISSRLTNAYYKKLSQAKQFPFAKDALNVDLGNFASLPVWTQLTLEAEIAVLAGKLGAVLNKNVVASVMDSFKTLDKPPNVAGFNHNMSYIATIFLASASWAKIALELKQEFAKSNATGPAVYRYILKYLHRTYGKDYHESAEVAAKILNGNKADAAGAVDAGPAVEVDEGPPLIEFEDGPPIGPINVVTPAAGDAGAVDDTVVANTPGAGDDLNASFVNEKDDKEEQDDEQEEQDDEQEASPQTPKLSANTLFYTYPLRSLHMRQITKTLVSIDELFRSGERVDDGGLGPLLLSTVNSMIPLKNKIAEEVKDIKDQISLAGASESSPLLLNVGARNYIQFTPRGKRERMDACRQLGGILVDAGYSEEIHVFMTALINSETAGETAGDASHANGLTKRKRKRSDGKTNPIIAPNKFVSRTPLVTKAKAIEILQGEIDAGNNNPLLQLTLRKLKSS